MERLIFFGTELICLSGTAVPEQGLLEKVEDYGALLGSTALAMCGDHSPSLYQIPSILQYIIRRSSMERG